MAIRKPEILELLDIASWSYSKTNNYIWSSENSLLFQRKSYILLPIQRCCATFIGMLQNITLQESNTLYSTMTWHLFHLFYYLKTAILGFATCITILNPHSPEWWNVDRLHSLQWDIQKQFTWMKSFRVARVQLQRKKKWTAVLCTILAPFSVALSCTAHPHASLQECFSWHVGSLCQR